MEEVEDDGAQAEPHEEVINNSKRAHDYAVFDVKNWIKKTVKLQGDWPVIKFKGATWFYKQYSIFGLPVIPRLGYKLALKFGRARAHTFFVELTDAHGTVLCGSYPTNEDYIRGFVEDEEGMAEDFQDCVVVVSLRVKGPLPTEDDDDDEAVERYDTGEYDLYVEKETGTVRTAQLSRSKRLRVEGEVPRTSARKPVMVVPGSTPDFDWGKKRFTALEILVRNAPCRLMVKLPVKNNMDIAVLTKEMDRFLPFVFQECARLPGMKDLFVYDSAKLGAFVMESEKCVLFVYDDPQLYFANVREMGRFWEYASFLLARVYPFRSTELVYLQYDNYVFRRKFLINSSCWGKSPKNVLLVPQQDQPDTLKPSKSSASRVDLESPPIDINEIIKATLPVRWDTIPLDAIVMAITSKPDSEDPKRRGVRGLERLTQDDFSKQTVRNRIMFQSMQPPSCLYHLDRQSTSFVHEPYLTVDLNGMIRYNCSCNLYYDDKTDKFEERFGRPKELLQLQVVEAPPMLHLGAPISSYDSPYSEDDILENGLVGIARFLGHVFHRRLKFVADEHWYYWTGEIWKLDVGSKFMTRYLTEAIPEWLKQCEERTDEKAKLKKITKMHCQFCNSPTHSVRAVLELLRYELHDPNFEEKSRHRGYFAANNCIVDLRSGLGRPYQYDDTVTQRCLYAYDACHCAVGQCFRKVQCDCDVFDECPHKCDARCAEDMTWIDDRIREICGTDLMTDNWYYDDKSKAPMPRDSQFRSANYYWVDRAGNEYAEKPSCEACEREYARAVGAGEAPKRVCACPAQTWKVHRVRELAFEDNGMRNYDRFGWTVGYILTGYADRKLFVYGYGDQNNGKTLIWNSLMDVLNIYLGPMHASCIFGRTRNDDGATPAMIHAVGKRGGIVSETGRNDVLNDHSVKVWAGRDPVVIRKMRSEMIDVKPDLVAMANANVEPKINILDEALWDRFHLLLYPMTYSRQDKRGDYPGPDWELHERPRNDAYVAEFEKHRYKHALANWAIRAARKYLHTPECPMPGLVKTMVSGFKNSNNPIPQFIGSLSSNYYFDVRQQVPLKSFLTALTTYCQKEGIKFKFDQPGSFRNLIAKLASTDSIYRLSMTGIRDSQQEMIVGIGQYQNPQ